MTPRERMQVEQRYKMTWRNSASVCAIHAHYDDCGINKGVPMSRIQALCKRIGITINEFGALMAWYGNGVTRRSYLIDWKPLQSWHARGIAPPYVALQVSLFEQTLNAINGDAVTPIIPFQFIK